MKQHLSYLEINYHVNLFGDAGKTRGSSLYPAMMDRNKAEAEEWKAATN